MNGPNEQWWMRLDRITDTRAKRTWRQFYEEPAFRYELSRRAISSVSRPFVELSVFESQIVCLRFGRKTNPLLVWIADSEELLNSAYPYTSPQDGFSRRLPVAWNLRASNHALTSHFLKYIEEERALQKVKPSPHHGCRNRPVSWRWLDLLDNPLRLDDSDRSHLSQARKNSKELVGTYKAALLEVRKGMPRIRAIVQRRGWTYMLRPWPESECCFSSLLVRD